MPDLDKALSDIVAIRSQIAAGTAFQGYGPGVMALTAALALGVAAVQALWPDARATQPAAFVLAWIGTAAIALGLIGAEMVARSKRHHSGLANALIYGAVEQFLPAGAAGALMALVVFRCAPDTIWILPGLWQVLVSLGLFASLRTLPKPVMLVAGWYLVVGLAVLMLAAGSRTLSPWTMGLPFAFGQALLAVILHRASGGSHDEA